MQPLTGFLLGFALALIFGAMHHFALTGILKYAPHSSRPGKSLVVVTFSSLLALHTIEILALSGVNVLVAYGWSADLLAESPPDFWDMLYLTTIAFTTLGYASLDAVDGFRHVLMFESLLGFMLLTWSATFLFSACQKSWQQPG